MTARHSAAVARYSREIAAEAGLSAADQDLVHSAGLLHDIGKFVLPDSILKSGRRRLTEVEWEAIKTHPAEGARIVSEIDGYQPIGDIILAHHERLDGARLSRAASQGEEIPELARIIAVADTYDVMTARDTYREPVSSYEAVIELRRVSGTQLDPRFVEALVQVLEGKDLAYRHGEDADFEAELALDRRIHDYVQTAPGGRSGSGRPGPCRDKPSGVRPERLSRAEPACHVSCWVLALAVAHSTLLSGRFRGFMAAEVAENTAFYKNLHKLASARADGILQRCWQTLE